MEVKKGYKQTEVGVIPEDWDTFSVSHFLDLLTDYDANGSFESVAKNVNVYDKDGFAWYVRSTDLENDSKLNEVKYVDEKSYNFLKKTSLKGNELLFLKRGDIGKVYLFEMKTKYATLAPNLYLLKLNQNSNSEYLFYFFKSHRGQLQLKSKNASSTLGALYKDDVKSIIVPLPPTIEEQRAIAGALSDVDELISRLETLITKKKAIKQGAMQELLTGKTRLKGFEGTGKTKQTELGHIPEDWEVVNLGKSSTLKARIGWQGLTTAEYLSSGDYYLITGTDFVDGYIDWDNCVYVDKSRFDQDKNIQINTDDILVTKDGTIGKVAFISKIEKPTTLNSGVFVIRPIKNRYYPLFLYFILMSDYFLDFLARLTAGSTISHLYQKDFIHFDFPVPKNLLEQKAIAQILSEMDQEIEQLEAKKAKYQTLKQGMMQELLTGKTRLV